MKLRTCYYFSQIVHFICIHFTLLKYCIRCQGVGMLLHIWFHVLKLFWKTLGFGFELSILVSRSALDNCRCNWKYMENPFVQDVTLVTTRPPKVSGCSVRHFVPTCRERPLGRSWYLEVSVGKPRPLGIWKKKFSENLRLVRWNANFKWILWMWFLLHFWLY